MCLKVRSRIIESEIDGHNDDGLCESREFKHKEVVKDSIYWGRIMINECVAFIWICVKNKVIILHIKKNVAINVWLRIVREFREL